MKKLEKIKLKGSLLTPNELKNLKGGDVKNNNTTSGCVCSYNNMSSVTNDNNEPGCKCTCNK